MEGHVIAQRQADDGAVVVDLVTRSQVRSDVAFGRQYEKGFENMAGDVERRGVGDRVDVERHRVSTDCYYQVLLSECTAQGSHCEQRGEESAGTAYQHVSPPGARGRRAHQYGIAERRKYNTLFRLCQRASEYLQKRVRVPSRTANYVGLHQPHGMKYGLKGASSGPAGSRLRAVGRNSR